MKYILFGIILKQVRFKDRLYLHVTRICFIQMIKCSQNQNYVTNFKNRF